MENSILQTSERQEIEILHARLTEAEDRLRVAEDTLRRAAGAIIDTDLKTFHAMKQLLTANDVYKNNIGHDPMRVNILEILNDLRRFTRGRFEAAGIIAMIVPAPNGEQPDASHGNGDRQNRAPKGVVR